MLNIAVWPGGAAPPFDPQLLAPLPGQRVGGRRRRRSPVGGAPLRTVAPSWSPPASAHAMLNIAVWPGGAAPPFDPQLLAPLPGQRVGGRRRRRSPVGGAPLRTVAPSWSPPASARSWPTVRRSMPPTRLRRQTMARTQTWTASGTGLARERSRRPRAIGNDRNQSAAGRTTPPAPEGGPP